MKRFRVEFKPVRLEPSELRTKLGKDHFIFVGSGTDMFAGNVKDEWIEQVFKHCEKYPGNIYLFQSKNPSRFLKLRKPNIDCVYGTTIESNRDLETSKAPIPRERAEAMKKIEGRKMVTIEPILQFDLEEFSEMIEGIGPEWVNIGADSQKNNLPEPTKDEVLELAERLNTFTAVKKKLNLDRLLVSVK
jgi:protein gp37